MFFSSLGRVLERCAEVLRVEVRPAIDDVFLVQQIDAIALMVEEIGAAWSDLFAALERENMLLAQTLAEARPTGRAELPRSPVAIDPLRRNTVLLASLDRAIEDLHRAGDDVALGRLRRGLRAAAEVEHELLTDVRDRTGSRQKRRL